MYGKNSKSKIYNKADELLGTENHYANIFTDANGNYFPCLTIIKGEKVYNRILIRRKK